MSHVLAFIAIALVVNLTPGPAMLHCVASGVSRGPRAGIRAALGVELGVFVYVVATVTGLAALLVSAPTAYTTVQLIGICFLAYMAWTSIPRGKQGEGEDGVTQRGSGARPFVKGFLLNVSNPKIALFFLTILPQLVPSGASSWQLLAFGLGFNLSGFTVNTLAGLLGHQLAPATDRLGPVRNVLPWIPPAVFLALTAAALWSVIT
ncbi:LysE family translocator [Streptomyces sp. NPDC048516]|uniref:LysE family translocator n=1 Tax=Streptomyces sp. NPDC048516 TaxID=3365565 RepID=UPI003711F190